MIEVNKEFQRELGRRIAKERKQLGLTQVEMAEQFECSQSMIACYEAGSQRVPVSFLPEFARMFGISIDELMGFTLNKTKKAKLKKPGPPSKLEKQFLAIQKLPPKERQFVIRMLDNALANAS